MAGMVFGGARAAGRGASGGAAAFRARRREPPFRGPSLTKTTARALPATQVAGSQEPVSRSEGSLGSSWLRHRSPTQWAELQAGYWLPATGYRLRDTGYGIPATRRRNLVGEARSEEVVVRRTTKVPRAPEPEPTQPEGGRARPAARGAGNRHFRECTAPGGEPRARHIQKYLSQAILREERARMCSAETPENRHLTVQTASRI